MTPRLGHAGHTSDQENLVDPCNLGRGLYCRTSCVRLRFWPRGGCSCSHHETPRVTISCMRRVYCFVFVMELHFWSDISAKVEGSSSSIY